MLDYDKAIEKIGGSFKLTVLLQKRVREIIRGASPLVPVTPDMSPIDVALKEIIEDKIMLVDQLERIEEEAIKESPKVSQRRPALGMEKAKKPNRRHGAGGAQKKK